MDEQKQARQLYRRNAEQLYGDERLRASLTDEQAAPLLAWAAAEIKEAAYATADLDWAAAEAHVEERRTAVSRLLRLTNVIVARHQRLPPLDRQLLLNEFVAGLATMRGDLPTASDLAHTLQNRSPDIIYSILLQLITKSDEEE